VGEEVATEGVGELEDPNKPEVDENDDVDVMMISSALVYHLFNKLSLMNVREWQRVF
jgi:hypothetical protein